MSANAYRPHLIVLVEDDAARQIVNGFILHPNLNTRAIQVMRPLGGWRRILDAYREEYLSSMYIFPERRVALIVDCDNDQHRLQRVTGEVPRDLKDRTFVLGVLSNPEDLRRSLNMSFEEIGKSLAQDCSDDTRVIWGHALLIDNEPELRRMIVAVKPFLFP